MFKQVYDKICGQCYRTCMLRPGKHVSSADAPDMGKALIDDYVSAMTNRTTAATASMAASQTEAATLRTLRAANPGYVTPGDLSPALRDMLVRTSLDAHLQKVQAEQINALTETQISQTEAADRQRYIGRKTEVTVLDKSFEPLESYWYSRKTGQANQGTIRSKSVTGIIHDLSFEANVLMLRPTWKSRLILPDRRYIFVYIVNPSSLQPAVSLKVS